MQYEIKQISLTSVLKISFLVSLTVLSILLMFFTLIIARMANFINSTLGTTRELELLKDINFNVSTIVFGSIFNGLFLSILIIFGLALIIIFYNLYAKYIGGIEINLTNNSDNFIKTGIEDE